MISRNEIKYIKDLSRKSVRFAEGKFVVEGEKLVNELLKSNFEIDGIYATELWDNALVSDLTEITEKELARISHLKSPNKVLAVVRMPEFWDIEEESKGLTLFLDRINDPGNLGTIIRMADWFGVKHIVCTQQSVDVFNSKVIQSSMGSIFRIPVEYVDGEEFIKEYVAQNPNHPVLGAAMEGTEIGSFDFPEDTLLVMGSESHGIDSEINSLVTQHITIPKFGNAESLNVGVATGVLLWEWKRAKN